VLDKSRADVDNTLATADLWEKVIRKVRAGGMPPQGIPRPDQKSLDGLVSYLETSIDRASATRPNPGHATIHRLNRTEYANAVRDLLKLDVDTSTLLPADDESYGFDNIADVLKVSPALLERYLSASYNISRLAVGDMAIRADVTTYRTRPDLSQDGRVEGLPFGTRGGMAVKHNFPLDGEYVFKVRLWRTTLDGIRGLEDRHQVEILIDGQRVSRVSVGGPEDEGASNLNQGGYAQVIDNRLTVKVPVTAGPHNVAVTFLNRSEAASDDILQPFIRTTIDPVGYRGLPVLDRFSINGPLNPTGVGDTPSRRAIFTCRPKTSSEELPCARKILTALARRAYRRPVTDNDMEELLAFYQRGKNEGKTFEAGIEAGVQLLLASPQFLFRMEAEPTSVAGDTPYRVNDLELASRLSFFLWSTVPDDQLLNLATAGKLKDPAVLEQQVKRMLVDPRAEALVQNFAGQWLYLRNLKNIAPNLDEFPDFDDNLRRSMRRETELLFKSVMQEDRNVNDLMTADYTYMNERMARHYGVPGIYGEEFRRVKLTDANRFGLLGQASILTVTSYANRTSPVQRGKWIMNNILGTPAPTPPPNVPALKSNAEAGTKVALRQRMEAHRANPACAACHKVMDPMGFVLENYDAVGQWRTNDEGAKIDPSGMLFDGTKVAGPADLRKMLTSKPEIFTGVMTERLMTYALGRGVEYYDMPTIRAILRDAAKNNYRFSTLVTGVVKSAPFQMRIKKSPEGTPSADLAPQGTPANALAKNTKN
jgi:hypothetical protein